MISSNLTLTYSQATTSILDRILPGDTRIGKQPYPHGTGEVTMYRYGVDPETYLGPDGWGKIGHYTQVQIFNSTISSTTNFVMLSKSINILRQYKILIDC